MAERVTHRSPGGGSSSYENPFSPQKPTHLIGEREFCDVYSAAQFAQEWSIYLDTMVTITWPMLGLVDEAAVARGWTAFRKSLNSWMEA